MVCGSPARLAAEHDVRTAEGKTIVQTLTMTVTEAGPGRAVICVSGELDLSGADEVGSALHALIADHDLVVLDASTLTFLDSYALRVLLRAAAHAGERGAVFRIAAPRPTLRRVLEITGSDEILITWSDVETALSG